MDDKSQVRYSEKMETKRTRYKNYINEDKKGNQGEKNVAQVKKQTETSKVTNIKIIHGYRYKHGRN